MVLAKFRQRYPQGSLVGELIDIDRGIYIVRVSAIAGNITLATGLAGSDRVEVAEDKARERAIAALSLEENTVERSTQPISVVAGDRSDRDSTLNSLPKPEPKVIASSPSAMPSIDIEPQIDRDNGFVKNNEASSVNSVTPDVEISPPSVDNPPAIETVTPQAIVEPTLEPIPEPTLIERSPEVAMEGSLFEGTYNTATVSTDPLPDTNTSAIVEDSQSDEMAVVIEDIHQIIHQTDIEVKRLGWTKNDGKEFLKSRYGKYSRISLTDEQLLEFLDYLKSQPTPT